MRNGLRYSLIAVCTTSARWVKVAQPQPTRPGSVVSTFTTTRRIRFGAVRMVLMSRIFTGAVPRTACVYPGDTSGAIASAITSFDESTVAPAPIEREPIASRRFIEMLLVNSQPPTPNSQGDARRNSLKVAPNQLFAWPFTQLFRAIRVGSWELEIGSCFHQCVSDPSGRL